MDSPQSDNEQQPVTQARKTDVTPPQPLINASSSVDEITTKMSDSATSPLQTPESDASYAINAKLARLEGHLKNIGKTLTMHMGKEEVVTRSLVDLESKIRKIEKSLQETALAKAAAPTEVKKMEQVPVSHVSQESAVDKHMQAQQSNMGLYTAGSDGEQTENWAISQNFSSPGLTDHDETSIFFSESTDVFEASADNEDAPLNHDRYIRSGEGKKPLLIIIPVLCLLALLLFLVFYYNHLQKQSDKKLTITEPISISSLPADTATIQPFPTGDAQQAEPAPALSDTPVPVAAPPTIPASDTKDVATSRMPPRDNMAQGGFTVSVGSFKEKTNAMALTSKLANKGYPVQMVLLAKPKNLFRVTVGTFESRKEAASIAAQLQKKEQLTTAIIDLNKP